VGGAPFVSSRLVRVEVNPVQEETTVVLSWKVVGGGCLVGCVRTGGGVAAGGLAGLGGAGGRLRERDFK